MHRYEGEKGTSIHPLSNGLQIGRIHSLHGYPLSSILLSFKGIGIAIISRLFSNVQGEAMSLFERGYLKKIPPDFAVAENWGFATQTHWESPSNLLNPEFSATAL